MTMSKWEPEADAKVLRGVGKLGEELSELSKVCFRIVIQGLDGVDPKNGNPNIEALLEELADVMAQCQLRIEQFDLNREWIDERIALKRGQMAEWEAMFEPSPPSSEESSCGK